MVGIWWFNYLVSTYRRDETDVCAGWRLRRNGVNHKFVQIILYKQSLIFKSKGFFFKLANILLLFLHLTDLLSHLTKYTQELRNNKQTNRPGFPSDSVDKESACYAGDPDLKEN